jgi:hypothetical protein
MPYKPFRMWTLPVILYSPYVTIILYLNFQDRWEENIKMEIRLNKHAKTV